MKQPTRNEKKALAQAIEVFRKSDDETALLEACRVFRDALPPRKVRPDDLPPDYQAAGNSIVRMIHAYKSGVINHPLTHMYTLAGRAAVEHAFPSLSARKAAGKPDYAKAGRAGWESATYANAGLKSKKDVLQQIGKTAVRAAFSKSSDKPEGN